MSKKACHANKFYTPARKGKKQGAVPLLLPYLISDSELNRLALRTWRDIGIVYLAIDYVEVVDNGSVGCI